MHEVNESDLSKAEAAVAAATAGESEGNIRLFEVLESDFPPLPNSSHSLHSFLGSLSSACARRVARCVAAAPARVCLGSSPPAVSAPVAHAHASILHGVRNSGGTGGLLTVQRSTSYCLEDTVRVQGPTGRRRVKGGVSSPAVFGGRSQVPFPGGNQAQVPGRAREVWSHLPSTRRFLVSNSCHLGADWTSGNRWAVRRCVKPHDRGFGC